MSQSSHSKYTNADLRVLALLSSGQVFLFFLLFFLLCSSFLQNSFPLDVTGIPEFMLLLALCALQATCDIVCAGKEESGFLKRKAHGILFEFSAVLTVYTCIIFWRCSHHHMVCALHLSLCNVQTWWEAFPRDICKLNNAERNRSPLLQYRCVPSHNVNVRKYVQVKLRLKAATNKGVQG